MPRASNFWSENVLTVAQQSFRVLLGDRVAVEDSKALWPGYLGGEGRLYGLILCCK